MLIFYAHFLHTHSFYTTCFSYWYYFHTVIIFTLIFFYHICSHCHFLYCHHFLLSPPEVILLFYLWCCIYNIFVQYNANIIWWYWYDDLMIMDIWWIESVRVGGFHPPNYFNDFTVCHTFLRLFSESCLTSYCFY